MPTCQCGCGAEPALIKLTDHRRGVRRGEYSRFLPGHYQRTQYNGSSYKGVTVAPGKSGMLHRIRAEKALGRPLPNGAEVHHADGSRDPNAQLVICPSAAYHKLLHSRMRIVRFGGNPNTDKRCYRCRTMKKMIDFPKCRRNSDGLADRCKACAREQAVDQRARARLSA